LTGEKNEKNNLHIFFIALFLSGETSELLRSCDP
jgi:hypothetical protein